MNSAQDLVEALQEAPESSWVRLVADWLQRTVADADRDLLVEPRLSGRPVIDALAAAATEHVALTVGGEFPTWVSGSVRSLDSFWYPGFDSLFPNALAHTPVSFSHRGLFIEADSLESV